MEEVALRLGISAETVEYILDQQLTTDRVIPADLKITSLGFDELSLKKRHKLYVTIMSDLSDPEHPRVLAVESGRDERAAVRSHRTDMSAVYPQVCAAWLPNS